MADAIQVVDLTYAFRDAALPALKNITLCLPKGSRCLLVGANGAGKSTLLQILAGKKLVKASQTMVLGQQVFFNTPPGVTWLGTEWASNPVVKSDILVSHFIDSIGGWRHKERRDMLLNLLDVDLEWHMHEISDGERRRVQIVAGLMSPWEVLLLDEVTVDLDVLVRTRLLRFLVKETSERGATCLYATHIFDGLDNFPTHVCHMRLGETTQAEPIVWPIPQAADAVQGITSQTLAKMRDPNRAGSRLMELALAWLEDDEGCRRALEQSGVLRKRGAQKVVTDSEEFYKKYDYNR